MISLKGPDRPHFRPDNAFLPNLFSPQSLDSQSRGLFPGSRGSAYVSFFFWLFGNGCWYARVEVAAQLWLPGVVSSVHFYPVYTLENIIIHFVRVTQTLLSIRKIIKFILDGTDNEQITKRLYMKIETLCVNVERSRIFRGRSWPGRQNRTRRLKRAVKKGWGKKKFGAPLSVRENA